jgi:hypothetical protein
MNESATNRPRRSLLPLWVMVAIFALPVVAAWFFYFNPEYLPSGHSNRGELIDPPRPLAGLQLQHLDGGDYSLDGLQGNWTMVAVAAGECAAECQTQVHDMQQVRLALAENRYRLERVLILERPEADANVDAIAKQYSGTQVLLAEGDRAQALERLFGVQGAPIAGMRYLVDPFGNLMMQYSPEAPPKDMLHDLEKLFKASKNWIKGAQYGHR